MNKYDLGFIGSTYKQIKKEMRNKQIKEFLYVTGMAIFYAIVLVAVIDFIGLMLWLSSNQTPVDNYYVGRLSVGVIEMFYER